jgi:hypothetical protein
MLLGNLSVVSPQDVGAARELRLQSMSTAHMHVIADGGQADVIVDTEHASADASMAVAAHGNRTAMLKLSELSAGSVRSFEMHHNGSERRLNLKYVSASSAARDLLTVSHQDGLVRFDGDVSLTDGLLGDKAATVQSNDGAATFNVHSMGSDATVKVTSAKGTNPQVRLVESSVASRAFVLMNHGVSTTMKVTDDVHDLLSISRGTPAPNPIPT